MLSRKYNRIMMLGSIFLLLLASCSGGDSPTELIKKDVVPTNLNLSITIVGSDANNPSGDGSGQVQCTATATNAVRYGFKVGSQVEQESANGIFDYKFTVSGENNQVISVFAYSSTGDVISAFKTITVFVSDETGLVWADEFDTEGAVLTSNWFSEEVPPENGGWYNGEQQHYTARTDNAYVSNGTLKIVAKKENYTDYNSTKNYTSARLNSKFTFTYGRIEVRAKLPGGRGTWPAIWTLGSNITTVGWPSCGEIDIMEHVGNNIGEVSSAIHTPSSFGNTVNKGIIEIPDTTSEFHVYTVDWTADKMDFYVDDTLFYTYNPASKNSDTWPFNKDQFILLNIAMGGTLGGTIDPNFTQDTMEIDYVRVYQ
jgi:beta-glucanase (GH16 family)